MLVKTAPYPGETTFVAKFSCQTLHPCDLSAPVIIVKSDTLSVSPGPGFQWFLNGLAMPGDTLNYIIISQSGGYSVQVTGAGGCTALSDTVTITGVKPLGDGTLIVYPNPSHGSWYLTGNPVLAGTSFEVYDSKGYMVYQSKITGGLSEINLAGADGVYFLKVNTREGTRVRKLVKL